MNHLSFSTLRLISQCSYAFKLKAAGVQEAPAPQLEAGRQFHAALAARLMGVQFEEPLMEEVQAMLKVIQPLLDQLPLPLPEAAVEVRVERQIGGWPWQGFVDAIIDDCLYEFKTTTRLPSSPTFIALWQASVYAHLLKLSRMRIVYVTQKKYAVYEMPPHPNALQLIERIIESIHPDHLASIPAGLFHPFACQGCGYTHSCEFFRLAYPDDFPDLPF